MAIPFVLRIATAADAPAIARLHAESWRDTYRGSMRDDYLDGDVHAERGRLWEERLRSPAPNQHVVVAAMDGDLLGFGCAYGAADAAWGTELDNLHVARAARGGGIGLGLIAAVARWASAAYPGGGLHLFVVERNAGARRFYERLGAADAGGELWATPDGGRVPVRRYVWAPADVARLAARRPADAWRPLRSRGT